MAEWGRGLAGALAILALAGCSSAGSAVTIDGVEISDDELRFHMALVTPAVENGVSRGAVSAEDADAAIRDRAVEAAVRDSVVFDMAHDHGVIGYSDFAGMLAELERENTTRAEAIADGEIVYGVTSFTPSEFHSRALTNMRLGLIDKLGAPGGALEVSDDEVRAEYEANPTEWAAGVAEYVVDIVEVPGAALLDDACDAAVAQGDIATALGICAGASSDIATLDGAQPPPSGSPAAQILASAQTIEIGATADPIPVGEGAALVRLLERRVDPESALATYRERIRAQLIEKALDAEIDERVREAVVSVDRTRLDSLSNEGS